MIVLGRFGWLALVATLAACSAEVPGSSPESAAPDASSADDGGVVSGSTEEESPEKLSNNPPSLEFVTPDGWGPLRIGMTLSEVVAAAGADADPEAVGGPDPNRCDEFRPRSAPAGLLVIVEDGVLTRISVSRNSEIRTPEGFRVGDPGSRVLAAYGSRVRIEPHQYWESPAKYITVWREPLSGADPRGIRYEIDSNGDIAHIRAGGLSIEYVEGCV